MTHHTILSAIGSDRPGLVDELSEYIFDRGGNIEDSRMVNLRGQFAMMVLIGGDDAAMGRIRDDLGRFEEMARLRAELRPALDARPAAATAMPYRLTATAIDQAGLIHRIAHLLRSLDVNIESLDTRLASAPITGAPVFEMEVLVSVPKTTAISHLREKLGALCDDLNIDYQLAAMG